LPYNRGLTAKTVWYQAIAQRFQQAADRTHRERAALYRGETPVKSLAGRDSAGNPNHSVAIVEEQRSHRTRHGRFDAAGSRGVKRILNCGRRAMQRRVCAYPPSAVVQR
jgi:hypothetical protein